METPKYQRKYEELRRCYTRIQKLYNGPIVTGEGEDSFQSPKDNVLNFFRVCYELKEALKKDATVPQTLKGHNGLVEKFCNNDQFAALSLDISNQEKHVTLTTNRSGKQIGAINSHVHLVIKGGGHEHTKLTIEIDGVKEDCLDVATNVLQAWETFRTTHNL